MKQIIRIAFLAIFVLSINLIADTKKDKDCNDKQKSGFVKVQLLDDFADTMHELWHDAWVNKDYKLIMDIYPKAEEFVSNMENSEVPAGLEDRKEKWGRGVKALRVALTNLKLAIDENNEQQMLNAVENFHQIYELMVSMTKPYVKEVEDFHKSMAKLYHRNYPDFNLNEMQNDIKQMYVVLDQLDKVTLPEYYAGKSKEFKKIVKELRKSVKDLEKYINSNKNLTKEDKKLKDKVEKLHSDFHTMAELFE